MISFIVGVFLLCSPFCVSAGSDHLKNNTVRAASGAASLALGGYAYYLHTQITALKEQKTDLEYLAAHHSSDETAAQLRECINKIEALRLRWHIVLSALGVGAGLFAYSMIPYFIPHEFSADGNVHSVKSDERTILDLRNIDSLRSDPRFDEQAYARAWLVDKGFSEDDLVGADFIISSSRVFRQKDGVLCLSNPASKNFVVMDPLKYGHYFHSGSSYLDFKKQALAFLIENGADCTGFTDFCDKGGSFGFGYEKTLYGFKDGVVYAADLERKLFTIIKSERVPGEFSKKPEYREDLQARSYFDSLGFPGEIRSDARSKGRFSSYYGLKDGVIFDLVSHGNFPVADPRGLGWALVHHHPKQLKAYLAEKEFSLDGFDDFIIGKSSYYYDGLAKSGYGSDCVILGIKNGLLYIADFSTKELALVNFLNGLRRKYLPDEGYNYSAQIRANLSEQGFSEETLNEFKSFLHTERGTLVYAFKDKILHTADLDGRSFEVTDPYSIPSFLERRLDADMQRTAFLRSCGVSDEDLAGAEFLKSVGKKVLAWSRNGVVYYIHLDDKKITVPCYDHCREYSVADPDRQTRAHLSSGGMSEEELATFRFELIESSKDYAFEDSPRGLVCGFRDGIVYYVDPDEPRLKVANPGLPLGRSLFDDEERQVRAYVIDNGFPSDALDLFRYCCIYDGPSSYRPTSLWERDGVFYFPNFRAGKLDAAPVSYVPDEMLDDQQLQIKAYLKDNGVSDEDLSRFDHFLTIRLDFQNVEYAHEGETHDWYKLSRGVFVRETDEEVLQRLKSLFD